MCVCVCVCVCLTESCVYSMNFPYLENNIDGPNVRHEIIGRDIAMLAAIPSYRTKVKYINTFVSKATMMSFCLCNPREYINYFLPIQAHMHFMSQQDLHFQQFMPHF